MTGSITLAQVAERTAVLAVACSRCDRAGRYPLDRLIAQYGRSFGVPLLLRTLSADCPKRESTSLHDTCGVHCPDLPALFLPD
jgi:hypothetical protein